MFESVTISIQNNNSTDRPIDLGSLVECMLFYSKVSVAANYSILKQLLFYFGVDRLIELIDLGILEILYSNSFIGIFAKTENNITYHDPVHFSSPDVTHFDQIDKVFLEVYQKRGKSKRASKRFKEKIKITKNDKIVLESCRTSILDQKQILFTAKEVLKSLVPEINDPNEIIFRTEMASKGIVVETNLDYNKINKLYHKRVSPKHSSISTSYILSHLLNSENEIFLASSRLSELSASTLHSKLIGYKINYIFNRSQKSKESLEIFKSFLFEESKALKDAVNSNQIDLDILMNVLKKSSKFKKWLLGVNIDDDLIKKYYEEVTKETIIDKLPGKSTRWIIFTGLGIVTDLVATSGLATLGGLTLSALDSFWLDKIISGWKPNQFIEDDVSRLTKRT